MYTSEPGQPTNENEDDDRESIKEKDAKGVSVGEIKNNSGEEAGFKDTSENVFDNEDTDEKSEKPENTNEKPEKAEDTDSLQQEINIIESETTQ